MKGGRLVQLQPHPFTGGAGGDPVAAGRAYERETGTFDRNERAARGVWRTFGATIEVCAWRAHRRPAFADGLNTAVFFPKSSFEGFVWSLLRAW